MGAKEIHQGIECRYKNYKELFGILFSGVTTAHETLQSTEQGGDNEDIYLA